MKYYEVHKVDELNIIVHKVDKFIKVHKVDNFVPERMKYYSPQSGRA